MRAEGQHVSLLTVWLEADDRQTHVCGAFATCVRVHVCVGGWVVGQGRGLPLVTASHPAARH